MMIEDEHEPGDEAMVAERALAIGSAACAVLLAGGIVLKYSGFFPNAVNYIFVLFTGGVVLLALWILLQS